MWRLVSGTKRASLIGALFVVHLLYAANAWASCRVGKYDEMVYVEKVNDGDTVLLRDGRKLRFVGINTPEIGKDAKSDEPMAQESKRRLQKLIAGNKGRLGLQFDGQRFDRYERLLAHPFLADGRNLTEQLLAEGMGMQIVIPPNDKYIECYQKAERGARVAVRGVWSETRFAVIPAHTWNRSRQGFQRVEGKVKRVYFDSGSIWIDLDDRFQLQIKRHDLAYFPQKFLQDISGAKLEARGWVQYHGGKYRLRIRHAAAVDIQGRR